MSTVLLLSKIVDQTSLEVACQRPAGQCHRLRNCVKRSLGTCIHIVMPSNDAGGPCTFSPARIEFHIGPPGILYLPFTDEADQLMRLNETWQVLLYLVLLPELSCAQLNFRAYDVGVSLATHGCLAFRSLRRMQ